MVCRDVRPAASHPGLEHSQPAAGSILAAAPARVDAWFASALRDNGRSALVVSDRLGERVEDGTPRRDDPTGLWTGLRPGLPSGVYRVDWRSSAEDGHPAEGSFELTVDRSAAGDGAWFGAAAGVLIAAVGGGGVALDALLLVMRARRHEA